MLRLRVSTNDHYLEFTDSTPFLWVGDCAWGFTTRLSTSEATQYLNKRQSQGFTCVHCWLTPQWQTTNTNNDSPFNNAINNPDNAELNNSFWNHVESLADLAEARDIIVMIELGKFFNRALPANMQLDDWGTQAQRRTKSYNVGYRIANRMRSKTNVYFGVGGDFVPNGTKTDDTAANVEEKMAWMAAGVADGWENATYNPQATSTHFATVPVSYHPGSAVENGTGQGGNSRDYFGAAGDTWIAFHQLQSARASRFITYHYTETAGNYSASPTKPTIDTETSFEDAIPLDEASFRRRGWHVRASAYLNLFSGACGHNYGHVSIWQFYASRYSARGDARTFWDNNTVLDAEGAVSMSHLRRLMDSRPWHTAAPSDALVTTSAGSEYERIEAVLSTTHAMVYSTNGRGFTIDLSQLGGTTARAYWFNPRDGSSQQIGEYSTSGTQAFTPPEGTSNRNDNTGRDYILVLDDIAQNYPPPGSGTVTQAPIFVTGHRGAGRDTDGERPENTLQAFRWCWENGCHVECDMDDTSDGEYIFFHDATVDRTTNGTGTTISKTLAQIQALDAGSWFHSDYTGARVPELQETLTAFANEAPAGVTFTIDLDSTIENQTCYNRLQSVINSLGLWQRVFIQVTGDNSSVVTALKNTDSRFRLEAWCSTQARLTAALANSNFEKITMHYDLRAQVGSVHNAGKTCVLTMDAVNTLNQWCNLVNGWDEAPDGISTDRPRYLKEITQGAGYGV